MLQLRAIVKKGSNDRSREPEMAGEVKRRWDSPESRGVCRSVEAGRVGTPLGVGWGSRGQREPPTLTPWQGRFSPCFYIRVMSVQKQK